MSASRYGSRTTLDQSDGIWPGMVRNVRLAVPSSVCGGQVDPLPLPVMWLSCYGPCYGTCPIAVLFQCCFSLWELLLTI